MIHNPATLAYGDQAEMEKTIGMLSEVKESIINAYEIKSGLTRTKISHMMDDETLSLKQKELVYYLTEAALQGRDILFDQKKGNEEQPEAMLYSPVTVASSFVQKLKPHEPVNKVPAASLENRLALLIH